MMFELAEQVQAIRFGGLQIQQDDIRRTALHQTQGVGIIAGQIEKTVLMSSQHGNGLGQLGIRAQQHNLDNFLTHRLG